MKKDTSKNSKHIHDGCPMCGSPVLEDRRLCSRCEIEFEESLRRILPSATILEFPTGKVLQPGKK